MFKIVILIQLLTRKYELRNFSNNIQILETVFAQKIDVELVLLDMESERYLGLDATAIWQAL